MWWRALFIVGYSVAFLTILWAIPAAPQRARNVSPIALSLVGAWIVFYVSLVAGVDPLTPWLVALARLAQVLTFTSAIIGAWLLRQAGNAERLLYAKLSEADTAMRDIRDEMLDP